MTTLLIRDVDPALHARLKARAAKHCRSLEEEARELLQAALTQSELVPDENLIELVRRLFGPEYGIELDIPPRGTAPKSTPPNFSDPRRSR